MKRIAPLFVPSVAHADVAPESTGGDAIAVIVLLAVGVVVAGVVWLAKRKR